MDYKVKYFKYKTKYAKQLKILMGGGEPNTLREGEKKAKNYLELLTNTQNMTDDEMTINAKKALKYIIWCLNNVMNAGMLNNDQYEDLFVMYREFRQFLINNDNYVKVKILEQNSTNLSITQYFNKLDNNGISSIPGLITQTDPNTKIKTILMPDSYDTINKSTVIKDFIKFIEYDEDNTIQKQVNPGVVVSTPEVVEEPQEVEHQEVVSQEVERVEPEEVVRQEEVATSGGTVKDTVIDSLQNLLVSLIKLQKEFNEIDKLQSEQIKKNNE